MSAKEKKIMRIALRAPDRDTLAKLAKEHGLSMASIRPRRQPDGTLRVEAYVPPEMLERLQKKDAVLEIIEDATEVGRQRQKEVGKGDRFEGGKKVPRGLGKKE